jgi:hypothetical protein
MSNLHRGHSIPIFGSFGQAVSAANQKQELPLVAMFGNGS